MIFMCLCGISCICSVFIWAILCIYSIEMTSWKGGLKEGPVLGENGELLSLWAGAGPPQPPDILLLFEAIASI